MKNGGISGREREDVLFNLAQTIGSVKVKRRQVVTPYLPLSQLGISGLETGGHRKRGHVRSGREIGNSWELTLKKTPVFQAKMARSILGYIT